MRTVIEDEEELEASDTEITLGMKSLLGVFFAAVLVCGIFFGFGYSMGRGKTRPGSPPEENQPAKSANAGTTPAVKTVISDPSSSPAPSSASNEENDTPAVTNSQPAQAAQSTQYEYIPGPNGPIRKPIGKPLPNPKPSAAVSRPALPSSPPPAATVAPPNPATPALKAPAAVDTPSTTAATVMVQIAAISRQEDADVLVSALMKHGYSAVIRHDPKDNLLHVQIGPFARDEARTMRTRLLNDGYNAILK